MIQILTEQLNYFYSCGVQHAMKKKLILKK